MLAVCVLEQIKPSLIVAARRRAAALSLEALPPAGQRSTRPRSRSPASAQAAARDVVEVENPEREASANHPTVLGLTISGDIAR